MKRRREETSRRPIDARLSSLVTRTGDSGPGETYSVKVYEQTLLPAGSVR